MHVYNVCESPRMEAQSASSLTFRITIAITFSSASAGRKRILPDIFKSMDFLMVETV